MMNKEKINFREDRDFGETMNVSVKFLRQNFTLFFKCILFIAGPFVLSSAITEVYYESFSLAPDLYSSLGLSAFYGGPFLIFVITTIIANLVLIGTVYSFMLNYQEKGPGRFTVNDVSSLFGRNAFEILSAFIGTIIAMTVVFTVVIGITISLLPGWVLIITSMIIAPPLFWQVSVVYLIKMQDKKNVFAGYFYTRKIMNKNFWRTWLMVVCSAIIVGIISIVFGLPKIAFELVIRYGNKDTGSSGVPIPFMIIAGISTFFTTIIYSLYYVIYTFHYYALAEKKDGIGLMDRINEIGNNKMYNDVQDY